MPPRENSPYHLLVEGVDDLHSVIHLMIRHGYDWDDEATLRPYIKSEGSVVKLLDVLPITLKAPYQRIGVLVDADASLPDRWSQIRGRAEAAGLKLPAAPQPDGTIVPGLRPGSRVGFWLMPDNTSPGNLEHFLSRLVPADDPTWSYAGEATIEARTRGARCKEKDHGKSTLHTWLAWQEDPGLPFGTALRAKIFEHDSEEALRFVSWFHRLFVAS
jgi:hypothetical protein